MPRASLPVIGGFYDDPNRHWSAQDTLNVLPVRAEQEGTETPLGSVDVPGMKPLCDPGMGKGRGLRNVEGQLHVVVGTTLVKISNTGVAIPRGTIPGVGRVSLAHNQNGGANQLLVVNGSAGYVLHTGTLNFAKVTDEGYPGAFVAVYLDSYLAQVEPQGRYFFHSDLADAHAYSTLDRYEAEGQPDRIVTVIDSHRELLVFGKNTIEPYINDPQGDGTAPFQRASNTVIECGCSARYSPRKIDNTVMFLDDKRIVRRLDGYTPVRISNTGIEAALAECSANQIASAWAFTWEDRGHKVYYLTVPGRFTFGYDVKSGLWHRRAAFSLPHWNVVDVAYWNDQWVALTDEGKLYTLDWKYSLDGQDELVRERVTGVMAFDRARFVLDELELLVNVGGQATEPADFPPQPSGPTISGTAPDGAVGTAYAGYTYTITPGDASIVRTEIVDGALPAGLVWDELTASISTDDPVLSGTFSFTLRTEDANGLWALHTDSVVVSFDGIACGIDNQYTGGQSFPTTFEVMLGTGAGTVTLDYLTGPNPDRIVVTYDGIDVIDTGYVGDPDEIESGYSQTMQERLDAYMAANSLPQEDIVLFNTAYDGNNDLDTSPGTMHASFMKSSATTTATVKVYGPLAGTGWVMRLGCPA